LQCNLCKKTAPMDSLFKNPKGAREPKLDGAVKTCRRLLETSQLVEEARREELVCHQDQLA